MLFYRIVHTNPPTPDDFTSGADLGRPLPAGDAEIARLHTGISVFATPRQASTNARQWPRLGSLLAVLDIPEGGPIRWERTTQRRGHHTLWGSPADLVGRVVAIVPVADVR